MSTDREVDTLISSFFTINSEDTLPYEHQQTLAHPREDEAIPQDVLDEIDQYKRDLADEVEWFNDEP